MTQWRLLRTSIVGLSLLFVACVDVGVESTSAGPGESVQVDEGAVAVEPPALSVLDLLPEVEQASFLGNERYLVGLLVSPVTVSDGLRVERVDVLDPNGTLQIGDEWFEPFIEELECARRVDLPSMPSVGADYHPGDPGLSTATGLPGGGPDGVVWISVSVRLFDTAEQRSAAMDLFGQEVVAEPLCMGTAQERTLAFLDPIEVGYPGNGYLVESFLNGDLTARTFWFDYAVGDRVLLDVSYADRSPGAEIAETDRQLLDALVREQIEHLRMAGVG